MEGTPTRGIINLDTLESWPTLSLWSSDDAWWDEVAKVLHTEGRSLSDYMQVRSKTSAPVARRSQWRRTRLPQTIRADAQQLEQELLALFDG